MHQVTPPDLWDTITSWDNLIAAYAGARKGKPGSKASAEYGAHLEENVITLQGALMAGTWRPGLPDRFSVVDPKPRQITAPPFADRVVHHALVRQIEAAFERRFISESYACRKGMGTQAAVKSLQGMIRVEQRNHGAVFVLKADISKYFASINHDRLIEIAGRVIKCQRTMALIRAILSGYGFEEGVGLPVGALTSQLFANVYLDQLDHYVKDQLGERHYLRYMDDFCIVHHDKAELWRLYDALADMLATRLSLRLNRKTTVVRADNGVDFCGYRIWSTHILPRQRNVRRARKRLTSAARAVANGADIDADLVPQLMSFLGYVQHANARRTAVQIMRDLQETTDLWEIVRRRNARHHAHNARRRARKKRKP